MIAAKFVPGVSIVAPPMAGALGMTMLNFLIYETLAAASAPEAESMLAALQPGDVFITDYHLDGKITGLEVLSQLRLKKDRDVPAILLSGDLHSIMRTVKTPIACCRFLSKPVDTKALLAAIAELSRP